MKIVGNMQLSRNQSQHPNETECVLCVKYLNSCSCAEYYSICEGNLSKEKKNKMKKNKF